MDDVLKLTAFCPTDQSDALVAALQQEPLVGNVARLPAVEVETKKDMVTAFLHDRAADSVLARLRALCDWEAGELSLITVDMIVRHTLTGFVTVVDAVTIVVAIVAGVAAMVAFVTAQGLTAVGVAISVTTIPAASYAGVAFASGALDLALDALGVLGVNIVSLVLAQCLTLVLIRAWEQREARRAATWPLGSAANSCSGWACIPQSAGSTRYTGILASEPDTGPECGTRARLRTRRYEHR